MRDPGEAGGGLAMVAGCRQCLQIGAGAKRAFAGARHEGDAKARIGGIKIERARKLSMTLGMQRIQHFRPIDRDCQDVAIALDPAIPVCVVAHGIAQYVARPPDRSNVAPVVKLHSGLAIHATIAAISGMVRNRPIGILAFIAAICSGVISLKRSVSVMTGAMQFLSLLALRAASFSPEPHSR